MTNTVLKEGEHQKVGSNRRELNAQFISLMRTNARNHRLYRVFSDFCEMSAIAISNAVDKSQFKKREERYLQIVAAYTKEEVYRFSEMLVTFTLLCETGFRDHLGEIFMALEMGDEARGQFFTPYEISSMMAQITLSDDALSIIEKNGFMTVCEPTCGAGSMVIAIADTILEMGVNYQKHIHVTAQDIDALAVHITYIQMALFHIPGVVLHGNTLKNEILAHWLTPAHVMGAWGARLHRRFNQSEQQDIPPNPNKSADADEEVKPGDNIDESFIMSQTLKSIVTSEMVQLDLF